MTWRKISGIGVSDRIQEKKVRSIILVNRIAFIMEMFLLSSILINVIIGTQSFIPVLSIASVAIFSVFLLNRSKYFTAAKITMLLTTLLLLIFMCVSGGAGSGIEFYFLSLLILPPLIFHEKRMIFLFQILCVAGLIIQHFTKVTVVPGPEAESVLKTFFVVNSIYSSLLIILGVMFYRNINSDYEIKLKENYKKLKTAQDELYRSEALLSEGQRMAHLGSWEYEIAATQLRWSDEMYRILGYQPKGIEAGLVAFIDHIHPDDREKFRDVISNSLSSLNPFSLEIKIVKADGSEGAVYVRGRIQTDENNVPTKIFGSALDITAIKNTNEQLRQKDEFISIASHELKTPLTSIKAYSQLLAKSLKAKSYEQSLHYCERSAKQIDRIESLINDLLEVSRLNNKKLTFQFTSFDFSELVDECIDALNGNTIEHELIIVSNPSIIVKADRQRLEQVIMNYLTNAIKYSPDGKRIEIKVEKGPENLVFSVKDQGIGIPADSMTFLFTRFFRVQNTSSRFPGLGVGLYISHEIIANHHGRTWVESKEGEGSTFYFSIPLEQN